MAARRRSSNRAVGTITSQRLEKIHDQQLWSAFIALQVAEDELKKIPDDDLRTPIAGFRDKRWILAKISTLRADLETLSAAIRSRAFPPSTR